MYCSMPVVALSCRERFWKSLGGQCVFQEAVLSAFPCTKGVFYVRAENEAHKSRRVKVVGIFQRSIIIPG